MDIVFIAYTTIVLIFFIYSIISYKKKKIIYTIRNEKMNIVKDDYYNLQLLFCMINCVLLLLESVIIYNKENTSLFMSCYIATFWLINYLLKFTAIKIKYINIII